ncbi:DDE transposase family protein [Leptolyngbya ohadii]|uniref:DDE transposase family protein n=1 Tax=Leptolyngbya ohadii TaxID=1962290 RepID=UPI000B59DB60|nr:DDE transposase family protein [Leptolyngbya ohadii]
MTPPAQPNSEPSNSELSGLEQWYIVKQPSGICQILPAAEVAEASDAANQTDREKWGPFASQGEAIARRVGLIRAGKCQPQ